MLYYFSSIARSPLWTPTKSNDEMMKEDSGRIINWLLDNWSGRICGGWNGSRLKLQRLKRHRTKCPDTEIIFLEMNYWNWWIEVNFDEIRKNHFHCKLYRKFWIKLKMKIQNKKNIFIQKFHKHEVIQSYKKHIWFELNHFGEYNWRTRILDSDWLKCWSFDSTVN